MNLKVSSISKEEKDMLNADMINPHYLHSYDSKEATYAHLFGLDWARDLIQNILKIRRS